MVLTASLESENGLCLLLGGQRIHIMAANLEPETKGKKSRSLIGPRVILEEPSKVLFSLFKDTVTFAAT